MAAVAEAYLSGRPVDLLSKHYSLFQGSLGHGNRVYRHVRYERIAMRVRHRKHDSASSHPPLVYHFWRDGQLRLVDAVGDNVSYSIKKIERLVYSCVWGRARPLGVRKLFYGDEACMKRGNHLESQNWPRSARSSTTLSCFHDYFSHRTAVRTHVGSQNYTLSNENGLSMNWFCREIDDKIMAAL